MTSLQRFNFHGVLFVACPDGQESLRTGYLYGEISVNMLFNKLNMASMLLQCCFDAICHGRHGCACR